MKRLLVLGLVMVLGLSFLAPLSASAATSIDYNNIIADTVFDNSKSMSASQIDSFLNGFPSSCISTKNGFKAPDVIGYNSTDGFKYGSSVSAGTVIAHASQTYGLNPQVLLATLQKEQSLVSGSAGCYNEPNPSWPSSSTPANGKTFTCSINGTNTTCTYACTHGGGCINVALGYGCPYYCKASYEGFSKQIINAAWKLTFDRHRSEGQNNWYLNKTNWDNSDDLQWCYSGHQVAGGPYYLCPDQDSHSGDPYVKHAGQYNICMSGTSGCRVVTIQNGATAALYNYTPFLHGQDLFFANFTNWFGPTTLKDDYKFEKLAGSGGVLPVSSSSLGDYTKTITYGSDIYTFYYDATNKCLRLAHWNGSKWINSILDGPSSGSSGHTTHDVGQGVTATIWHDIIQVYYYDATSGDLRHAWLLAGYWHTETMDGSGSSLGKHYADVGKFSTVTIWKDQLQLYYYDASSGSMRHAWWPGGRWHFETMDGTSGSLGKSSSDIGKSGKALVWNGQLQLYYYDATSGNLRHAWWPGDGRWHFETMDGTSGSLGKSNADLGSSVTGMIWNNQLQLYYYDATSGNLRHAWWPGDGRWHFETMDGTSGSVFGNDNSVGSNVVVQQFQKDLFIFYYDSTEQSWKASYWDTAWHNFNLDGGLVSASRSSAPVGGQLSADVYQGKSLQIFYKGSAGDLHHVWANR